MIGQMAKSNAKHKTHLSPPANKKGEMVFEMSCQTCVARVCSNLPDCDESGEQDDCPPQTESYRDAWTLFKLKRILRNDFSW